MFDWFELFEGFEGLFKPLEPFKQFKPFKSTLPLHQLPRQGFTFRSKPHEVQAIWETSQVDEL